MKRDKECVKEKIDQLNNSQRRKKERHIQWFIVVPSSDINSKSISTFNFNLKSSQSITQFQNFN